MKTITVKGVGHVAAKPDTVELRFKLKREDPDYEKTMKKSSEAFESLKEAFQSLGFSADDLKTTSFSASKEDDSVRDQNGRHLHYVFRAYSIEQRWVLRFPFEQLLLARVLSVVAKSATSPEFSIHFTVADPSKVQDELLADAAKNAQHKALILARAAGSALGELQSIDYNWSEVEFYSRTDVDILSNLSYEYQEDAYAPDITPDDIETQDTATFVWTLE